MCIYSGSGRREGTSDLPAASVISGHRIVLSTLFIISVDNDAELTVEPLSAGGISSPSGPVISPENIPEKPGLNRYSPPA